MVPQLVTGNTGSMANDFEPSCAAGASPDMAYLFTAPTSGQYVADTIGSSFDTVLHVFQHPSCAPGPCDDDGGGNLQSRVTGWMDAGDRILLVVDGFGGDGGSYVLHITQAPPPPPCPEQDLGNSYPQTLHGTTSGASHFQGSCGGDAAPERTYAFTAPVTGTYHVFTVGSSYDTLIYARANTCNGPELGCDDDGAGNSTSWIPLNLAAGQTAVIFVDGWGSSQGPYTLNILGP